MGATETETKMVTVTRSGRTYEARHIAFYTVQKQGPTGAWVVRYDTRDLEHAKHVARQEVSKYGTPRGEVRIRRMWLAG